MRNNDFERLYDGLFTVSKIKSRFKKGNEIIEPNDAEEQPHRYDIPNPNIYDFWTKNHIESDEAYSVGVAFIAKLKNIHILEVFPFLNYQYENASNKQMFVQKIKYNTLMYMDQEWREEAIKDWTNEISDKTSKTKAKDNNLEEKTKSNIFSAYMPLSIPEEHFKKFTTNKSKNGEPFLTNEQFDNFIKRAFLGIEDIPKQKFNQAANGEKFMVQYVFREFYEDYSFEYFGTGQVQDKFIKLLTENFNGWEFKNVKDNFNHRPKKFI
jgi:hypothetical protein